MVERPIKKSERQAKAESGESQDISAPSEERNSRPARNNDRDRDRSKGKGKGKGKKGSRDDSEPKQMINPALARGPRPVKPQPPVAVEEPLAVEADADVATESTEAAAEE